MSALLKRKVLYFIQTRWCHTQQKIRIIQHMQTQIKKLAWEYLVQDFPFGSEEYVINVNFVIFMLSLKIVITII